MLQMPGQPRTPGFVSAQQRKRKRKSSLYRYTNGLILEDGEVRYVSINNGPPQLEIRAGASVVDFSPVSPYRPQRIRTFEGTINVLWAGNRLLGYRADSGERIDLRYDQAGRVVGLRGSDGQVVDYRFDSRGRLRSAVDGQGHSVSYWLPESDGPATGIHAEFPESPGGAGINYGGRLAISHGVAPEALRQQTAALSTDATVFIGLLETPAGSNHAFNSVVAGQDVAASINLERVVEAVLHVEKGTGPQSNVLRAAFLDVAPSRGRSHVVVTGEPYMRNLLARALGAIAPGLSISTAANPGLAARNLAVLNKARPGFRHVHVVEGLDATINEKIQPLAAKHASTGDLVIASGHNSTQFKASIEQLASAGALKGKTVLLVTCGEGGGAWDGLLQDAGAVQVIAFDQPINQQLLEPFLTEIDRRLEGVQQPPATVIRKIVDEVIKDLMKRGLNVKEDDVRVLQMQVRQIGRLDDGADSPFVRAPGRSQSVMHGNEIDLTIVRPGQDEQFSKDLQKPCFWRCISSRATLGGRSDRRLGMPRRFTNAFWSTGTSTGNTACPLPCRSRSTGPTRSRAAA